MLQGLAVVFTAHLQQMLQCSNPSFSHKSNLLCESALRYAIPEMVDCQCPSEHPSATGNPLVSVRALTPHVVAATILHYSCTAFRARFCSLLDSILV
jgi:hypothetical protein